MKVLILDAHAPPAAAVVQSLGRKGIEVHAVVRGKSLASSSRSLGRLIELPAGLDDAAFIDWLRALDAREMYTLVVPTTDSSVMALQHCADDDDLRRKAALASRADIETALDKMKTWTVAERLGIPVPSSAVLRLDAAALDSRRYPVVLKTLKSQVVRDGRLTYVAACIARNTPARTEFLDRWLPYTPVLEQEYFAGHGWGVECLYAHGQLRWHFAHERLHELPLTGGASSYRRAVACPEPLLRCARMLLDALRWHGVAMVEFRRNSRGEFVLLEINPRLWGSLPLAIRAGVDFPLGLYLLARGENPGESPVYRPGVYMRNLLTDLEWMRENWFADRSDPLLLTDARWRSVIQWLRPLTGSEGWDHFSWRDLGPTRFQLSVLIARVFTATRNRVADWRDRRRMLACHSRNLARLRPLEAQGRRVVFVCHGNICRSPFAERLATQALEGWSFRSTGLHEQSGRGTPDWMIELAREFGVDLAQHRSNHLDSAVVEEADHLLVMDTRNYIDLVHRFPQAEPKILFLGMFCSEPTLTIADPALLELDDARESLRRIASAIDGLRVLVRGRGRD